MVPRSRKYYEGATTSHWRIDDRLFFFASAVRVILLSFVSAMALLEGLEAPSPGPGIWLPVARSADDFTWTPMGSLKYPGDPSCAFAPLLDPGRTDVPLPWRSHRCCPRLMEQRRLRTMGISGLDHAASAPALLRFALRVATRAQGWLPAGWLAFAGRVSNPLDHSERFQFTWSSSSPGILTLSICPRWQ
jgi:hypothetical protein